MVINDYRYQSGEKYMDIAQKRKLRMERKGLQGKTKTIQYKMYLFVLRSTIRPRKLQFEYFPPFV